MVIAVENALVTPRFQRFVERWPTVEALAAAPDEDVLSEWAGLGYYARARNLIACARQVAARGTFPSSEGELRTLPGIGDYTAAAIAAIAFGRRALVMDTNVERVVARLARFVAETVPIPFRVDRLPERFRNDMSMDVYRFHELSSPTDGQDRAG